MQKISATPFGRRAVDYGFLAAQTLAEAPTPDMSCDKWRIFDDLRTARGDYGLSDRDLTVLNALLSFLPARVLEDGADLIVFPSNTTLAARAHGMAESTLRRHLARLVAAGVIARHDSPNGKRYARRGPGGVVTAAYGFSLRPLLVQASEITDRAEAARAEIARLAFLREKIVIALRDVAKLLAFAATSGLQREVALTTQLEALRTALRRKPDADLLDRLQKMADDLLHHARETLELNGTDSQNERHKQNSKPDYPESESCNEPASRQQPTGIPLTVVLKACPDVMVYARIPIRSTSDLVRSAAGIAPMMGIAPEVWQEATRIMGDEAAAVTLACILQRMAAIRNPGGYLRHLSGLAAADKFSPAPMVMALLTPENRRAM